MFTRSLPVVLLLAALAYGRPLQAQQPQGPPFDPNAVLATLKDLKTKQQIAVNKEKSGVSASINAAIADPTKFYELAVTAVELQGGGANDASRLTEWRKRHGNELRNRDFADALRLHLVYLNLTWQHSMGVKTKDQLGALLDHVAAIGRNAELYSQFDIYRKSLSEGVFVPYFQIGPYIGGLKEWHDRPFDVEGIYEKIIFPELRTQKNPRLLDCWRDRIQLETMRATSAQNSLTANKFNNIRLPNLLWNRAEDELMLGLTNQAVADMLGLIKGHADHPDFDRWTARLTEIVTPPKGEVTVGPGTIVTPTP